MSKYLKMEQAIEKTLNEQIIEKMIDTLKNSDNFPDDLLGQLAATDLSKINDVKEVISKAKEEAKDEDTQAGN